MKKREIKAIILDVGGVLVLGHPAVVPIRNHRNLGVHHYISKKLKISLDQWFDAIDTTYVKAIAGEVSEAKTYNTIAKNVETTRTKLEKILIQAYKKNFKQNKELYRRVFKLKKQGYKIAILSDQWYPSKKALIPKRYSKKFNAVLVSCDEGIRKPDPRFYKMMFKKLKVSAKNTVFIDNQAWNLKPAKHLREKTILFKNNKQMLNELRKLGVKI